MKTRFGPFTLDSETRQLLRDGQEIHLARKAFDLLCTLLVNRPKVLGKDELQVTLWPDSHIDAAGLNVLVSEVRRALGDEAKRPLFIRTVHGVGYAFCGNAVHDDEPPSDHAGGADAAACWLSWGDRTFRLPSGEHVIGRDPRCDIWIDADGVSRRHAAIAVSPEGPAARLSDLGSTNGTFVGRTRVVQPLSLDDGDDIKMGAVILKFRRWSPDRAAQTRRIRRKRQ